MQTRPFCQCPSENDLGKDLPYAHYIKMMMQKQLLTVSIKMMYKFSSLYTVTSKWHIRKYKITKSNLCTSISRRAGIVTEKCDCCSSQDPPAVHHKTTFHSNPYQNETDCHCSTEEWKCYTNGEYNVWIVNLVLCNPRIRWKSFEFSVCTHGQHGGHTRHYHQERYHRRHNGAFPSGEGTSSFYLPCQII